MSQIEETDAVKVEIKNLNAWYGKTQALKEIAWNIYSNRITAFIGPSGCGKTTLLRSINRLNDLIPSYHLTGTLNVSGEAIYDKSDRQYIATLRKRIGMVFQNSNPLPLSIMDNLTLPLKEHFSLTKQAITDLAIEKLEMTNLLDEVKDKLHQSALRLSGGQQQRLCIARALMLEPEIILFDEPCSALDPISTYRIEDLLVNLRQRYTLIMVTHNMEQASRIADDTAFFFEGRIVESGKTSDIFTNPKTEMMANYLRGEF